MKNGWRTITLGKACPISNRKVYEFAGERPYYATGSVGPEGDLAEPLFVTFAKRPSRAGCMPKIGDVGFARMKGTKKVIHLEETHKGALFSTGFCFLAPGPGIDPRFLFYFVTSDNFQNAKDEAAGVGIMGGIKNADVAQVQLRIPSLPEQQRIVGILDESFDAIATAKANAEKNSQNARALFESHLQSAFTQRGTGFELTTLGKVCSFVGGSQPPKSTFSKIKKADNIRLIQIRDYKTDKHIVYIPRSQAKRFCDADDVMIGRYGPPLFQILRGLEGAYNVALMKAVPTEARLSRGFLYYFLKHSDILQHVIYHSERAAGQIGLTKETLEPYPIALPSLGDQKKIVETIIKLETESQYLTTLYERKLAALNTLKKSLLHQAFTGNL